MLQHNPLSSQTRKYKVSLRSKNGFYFILKCTDFFFVVAGIQTPDLAYIICIVHTNRARLMRTKCTDFNLLIRGCETLKMNYYNEEKSK